LTDRVLIHGIACQCLIGVDDDERLGVRPLVIDLDLEADCRPAARTDALVAALDYRAMARRARAVAEGSSFRLLESLAEAIAEALLAEDRRASSVRVRITKPGAVAGVAAVGVEIERRREERP